LEAPLRRKILLLTLAPEREGATDLIRWAVGQGKLVALGHTQAGFGTIGEAARAGAVLSTHLGNGLRRLTHKFDNALMAQLGADELNACFIADGLHVPPFALRTMLRAKGVERSILVSDATAAAVAPAGRYKLAGMAIERSVDGRVCLPGTETLAGSALALDQAVRNVVTWGLATPAEAIAMASVNPARLLASRGVRLARTELSWSDDLMPVGLSTSD
jgi:N-acetylglucosamine-6-phosphate deacetylase